MKMRFFFIVLCIFLLGSASLFAQVRGSIEGTATDENGEPLPGVVVKAVSSTLIQPRYYTTDENGNYRLIELPPGSDYQVEFKMMGFQTVLRTGITVLVNKIARVDVQLKEVAFEEQVIITGAAPVLDTTSSTSGVNVDRDFTERLPSSHSYQAALSMQGGSTGSSNPSVRGGGVTGNLYMFDGVDQTDPLTSTFGANLNADVVAEIEVMTGGLPAEFGRSSGGVINTVTRSGGNDFSVFFRLRLDDPSWQLEDRNDEKPDSDLEYHPTLSVGGPVIKDKLWFFLSYYYKKGPWMQGGYTYYRYRWSDGEQVALHWDDEVLTQFFYGKLTWSISPEHQVFVTYNMDPMEWDDDPYQASGMTISTDTFSYWDQGGESYGLNYTWIATPNLFFEAKMGMVQGYLNYGPMQPSDSYYRVRHSNPDYTDIEWGSFPLESLTDRNKDTYDISAKYYLSDLYGSHEFKSGFSYHQLEAVIGDFWVDNYYDLQLSEDYTGDEWGDWDNSVYWTSDSTLVTTHDQSKAPATTDYYAFYIQDKWRPDFIDGFTANIGLRFESQSGKNNMGTEVFENGWGDMIAPRLGFVWDIGNTGKHKLNMFWGRFYTAWTTMLVYVFNVDNSYERNYSWNPETMSWDFDYQTEPGENLTQIDPNLDPDYTDEFTLGYEREISDNWSAGISYTRKLSRNCLDTYRVIVAEDGTVLWNGPGSEDLGVNVIPADPSQSYDYYTNIDGNNRDYWGVELYSTAKIRNFTFMGSYTLSEAKGTTFDSPGRNASGVWYSSPYYGTPDLSENLYGYSIYHVKHFIKLNATYQFNWGTVVGLSGFWRSGYHYSKLDFAPLLGYPSNRDPNGRYLIIGERGEYELPSYYNIDLSIQQDFNLGKFGMITLIADIFNITNNEGVLGHVEANTSNFGQPNSYSAPMRWSLSLLYKF